MIGGVSAGSVVGMAGDWTSDRIGRRHLFLFSMALIAAASVGSAIASKPRRSCGKIRSNPKMLPKRDRLVELK
jgi:MFS family permease